MFHRFNIRVWILALVLLGFAGVLEAAEGPRLAVRLRDGGAGFHLGKVACFDVVVTWEGRGDRYGDCRLDSPKLENGRMIANEVETKVRLHDGKPETTWTKNFRFMPQKLGPGRIGAMDFTFRPKEEGQGATQESTTPPAFLSSTAVDFLVESGGWRSFRLEGARLLLTAFGFVFFCIISFFLGAWRGRSRLDGERREAEQKAREEAEGIVFSDETLSQLRLEGEGRKYYALLREELLVALCKNLNVTREKAWDDGALLEALKDGGLQGAEYRSLQSFLEESTHVRFGGVSPQGQNMDEALRRARSLVETVQPSDGGRI